MLLPPGEIVRGHIDQPHVGQRRIPPERGQNLRPELEGRLLFLIASRAASTHSRGMPASGIGVRHLAWLILSKEDVRMEFHKIWPVTRDCRTFVGTPDILCTETTCSARPGRCELKFLPDSYVCYLYSATWQEKAG